jgi:hypothetical protein
MLNINYDLIDPKYHSTIQSIESRPHVMYLRYLLSKRYSPSLIKGELYKMGLSSPHEKSITIYYLSVMDPVIKACGVSPLYANYKNKIMKKNAPRAFSKDTLVYRSDVFDSPDMQVKFCKFVKAMEISDVWGNEIFSVHGELINMPVDPETGLRILKDSGSSLSVDRILLSSKRYLIDKMILEGVSNKRIAEYFREKTEQRITDGDVNNYKKIFFNIRVQTIEERIKALEVERNSLAQLLKDIDRVAGYADMDVGDKFITKKQTEQRIRELDDNIKTLNAMFTDAAHASATSKRNDFAGMFADILVRSYDRFCKLDSYSDRDVVDPLVKTVKMMSAAHDKVDQISAGAGDTNANMALMQLYNKTVEEITNDEMYKANQELGSQGFDPLDPDVSPDEIGGIEEIGANFAIQDEDEE